MASGTEAEGGTVSLVVSGSEEGSRLDVVLAGAGDLSRTRVADLIRGGEVRVSGEVVGKPSHRLRAGDRVEVRIPLPKPSSILPEPMPLEVIYQDADIVVINKPAGVIVHPSDSTRSGTLVNALLHHIKDLSGIGGKLRPGIVHRLDRETSGVMVIAKNDRAHHHLSDQFKGHRVEKEYLALAFGRSKDIDFEVDSPIDRHPKDRKRMAVCETGRQARTLFHTEIRWDRYVLLRAHPETGRTHQIRVHLSSRNLPVVEDHLYGYRNRGVLRTGLALLGSERGGFFLHAEKLSFAHPRSGEMTSFHVPLEAVFQRAISAVDRTCSREEIS